MSRSRCLVAAAAAAALSAPAASAQQPAPDHTVVAQGVATVKVGAPLDRNRESSIRAAVEKAEAKALPRALADARAKAAELARLSGLALGGVVSISDVPATPYGPFFYGTFGPDRFCGTIRTPVFRRDASGKRRRVGTRTRHACRVPQTITASVTVTFAVQ